MQSDMRVLALADDDIWIDLEPDPTPTVLSHLRTYSIGREVEIEDVGEEWAILSLIGPRAAELAGFEGIGPVHAQRLRRWEGTDVIGVGHPARRRPARSAPGTRPPPASSPSPPAPSRSARMPPRSSGSSPAPRGSAPR